MSSAAPAQGEKPLHPLINPNSQHYERADGRVAIQELEEQLSVTQMIGFCKANIFKYEFRKFDKGALAADEEKIKTYEAYLELLEHFVYMGLGGEYVSVAMESACRKFRYKIGE